MSIPIATIIPSSNKHEKTPIHLPLANSPTLFPPKYFYGNAPEDIIGWIVEYQYNGDKYKEFYDTGIMHRDSSAQKPEYLTAKQMAEVRTKEYLEEQNLKTIFYPVIKGYQL